MDITKYTASSSGVGLRAAVVTDLHCEPYEDILNCIKAHKADLILVVGDVVNNEGDVKNGLDFLRDAAALYPVFFSVGNHEVKCNAKILDEIRQTGVVLLDNAFVRFRGLSIGGLSTGYTSKKQSKLRPTPPPKTEWLSEFERSEGFRVLMCHHPEYYPKHLSHRDIGLVLSGHAHGGQWRFFGRGVYSPGQGIFPRYTSGMHDGRLIVSRGLRKTLFIPRINNPTELIFIDFE